MLPFFKYSQYIIHNRFTSAIINNIRKKRNIRFLSSVNLKEIQTPPIFIIGPPRCGSTLFYQAMTHHFNLCFFSNEMMKYPYDFPFRIIKNDSNTKHFSDFKSNYGKTTGKNAPHEGYPFWRRFYPRNIHDYINNPNHLRERDALEIKRTLQYMQKTYRCPFITKTIENALRIQSLRNIFPEAVFLLIVRNPVFIIQSILKGRKDLYGDIFQWMGAKPENYENLKSFELIEGIAGQVNAIYRAVEKDANDTSLLTVYFEDFCNSPQKILNSVEIFLRNKGIIISKTKQKLPSNFTINKSINLSHKELQTIKNIFINKPPFLRYYE